MRNATNTMKKRKGFSLVEIVIVILIIAVLATAVFAGGSAIVKKSQVSRTESDLHNFSVAIEAALNETPAVANIKAANPSAVAVTDFKVIIDAVNENLSDDYKFNTTAIAIDESTNAVTGSATIDKNTGNLKFATDSSYVILESAKTDAWGNNYYGIFDFGERHCKGQSDFFVTVVSAGPNAQTEVGGKIEADDIFLLVQYSDGDVVSATYDVATKNDAEKMNVTTDIKDGTSTSFKVVKYDAKGTINDTTKAFTADTASTATSIHSVVVKGNGGDMRYAGGALDNTGYTYSKLPVNF